MKNYKHFKMSEINLNFVVYKIMDNILKSTNIYKNRKLYIVVKVIERTLKA